MNTGSRSLLLALLTAAVLALTCLAGPAAANDARITGERRISERVIELTIATSAFAGPTKVHVNLPVGYDAAPSRRWPVTYVTAGTMNNYNTFNNFLKGEKLTAEYPSIIVSPDGNSGYWSDWYNGGAFGPPKYETYVIEQLIPLIDARFRTRADRSHRAIFGISMGGYGATMLAAHHPDLFAAAARLSGAVDSNLGPTAPSCRPARRSTARPPTRSTGRAPAGGPLARPQPHRPRGEPARPRPAGPHRERRSQPGDRREPAVGGHGLVRRRAGGLPGQRVLPPAPRRPGHAAHVEGLRRRLPHRRELQARDPGHAGGASSACSPTRRAAPAKFEHRSIEPRFGVWGWDVAADPARALEFIRLDAAGDLRLALTGSGTTTVTSPAAFRGLRAVDVDTPAGRRVARPDRAGRIRFTVPLGSPHRAQQFTAAARAAGQDRPGLLHARLGPAGPSRAGARGHAPAQGAR